jgi:hypothetical protein
LPDLLKSAYFIFPVNFHHLATEKISSAPHKKEFFVGKNKMPKSSAELEEFFL